MKDRNDELSERQLLELIVDRLDKLILVLALQGREREDQIEYLEKLGYSNTDMAQILATPKGTIDWLRAKAKKGEPKE